MSIGDLYAAISANLAGFLLFSALMAYLSWKGIVVGGQRLKDMEKDRDYWRDKTFDLMNEIEPRLLKMATDPTVPVAPATTAAAPESDEVTP